jgi:hypothetical protein
MKKIRRKISLSRETLQNLTPSQLEAAAGAAYPTARTLCIDPSCPGNTCGPSCFTC